MRTPGRSRLDGLRRLITRATHVARDCGIPLTAQLREFRRFQRAFGIDRAEFYGYWLWDLRRPFAERARFISNVERRAIEYRMNPREPSMQVRNKAWATTRLEDAGIVVGEVLLLLTLRPGVQPTSDRYPFGNDVEAVHRLLANAPAEGIVIKPEDGAGGRSVHVFRSVSPDGLIALDGTPWSIADFLKVLEAERLWKVERRLQQHPTLAAIAGETLGTLRLVSYRTLDQQVHLGPAAWKIPVGLSGVDHFSHGSGQFASDVDPDTGLLGRARRWFADEHVDVHPLTGATITGATMPHWNEAKAVALRIADCFPDLASLGYDIAIGSDGPVVIEVNPCWGERTIQAPGPTGMVQGGFRQFMEERGYGDVIDFAARDAA